MKYIWEMFYKDKHPDVYLTQTKNFSPYQEINPLMDENIMEGELDYNSFCRYEEIFGKMQINMMQDKEIYNVLFDIFSRHLIEVDLKSTITKEEIIKRSIIDNIKNKDYGETAANLYNQLDYEKQYKIAHYINLANKSCGVTIFLFAKAVTSLLETGVVYYDKEKKEQIILYVGRKRNIQDEILIELMQELFLPMKIKNVVLWDKHFGIINENTTMVIDGIVIM